ncbi:hypothetical protein [Saccharibacillus deserti]|uniref:hypothetical protein n=1 Tax=Saccharibacillus deserti TaxID=1634444 RepID=UPI0015572B31|nr:hypothetical protein [Saccharibacillus deserti]
MGESRESKAFSRPKARKPAISVRNGAAEAKRQGAAANLKARASFFAPHHEFTLLTNVRKIARIEKNDF